MSREEALLAARRAYGGVENKHIATSAPCCGSNIAAIIPARRTASIDPMQALRLE
jgi:ABC-type lipoprotein release transport system permease subunit